MEYRLYPEKIIVRMDKGEEITEQLNRLAEKENIKCGFVSAIGALGCFSVGTLKTAEQEYIKHEFRGDYEIVSLLGNITVKDGRPYIHMHLAAADSEGRMCGGHFNFGYISGTCEMLIQLEKTEIVRKHDALTGLNLFDFD